MEVVCVYNKGVLKPLKKLKMREGRRVRVNVGSDKEEVIRKYSGLIKLDKKINIKNIIDLSDESTQTLLYPS